MKGGHVTCAWSTLYPSQKAQITAIACLFLALSFSRLSSLRACDAFEKGIQKSLGKKRLLQVPIGARKRARNQSPQTANIKACPSFPDRTSYMLAAKRNQKKKNQFKQSKRFKPLTIFPDNHPEGLSSFILGRDTQLHIFLPGCHANKQQLLWQPHYNASDAWAPEEVSEPVNNLKCNFKINN